MTLVRLVRHGRAEAGWDAHDDPDLDEFGWEQARATALELAPLGPLDVVTSPLLRCRSTAEPLCVAWGIEPVVEPAVAEIPSPDGVDRADRVDWLRTAMRGCWADLGPRYTDYRDAVVRRILAMDQDTVVVSHFVAINAVIGACSDDDRLVILSLDNASVTTVELVDGAMRLVEGGAEADTLIR